jgi:hypothetical protein
MNQTDSEKVFSQEDRNKIMTRLREEAEEGVE